MAIWVIGSMHHGGPTELFLVLTCTRRKVVLCATLWNCAYKRTLADNQNVAHVVVVESFLSPYLSGPFPYFRRHITVNKMC